jgi:ubiquitin carboxyl-terminal hydrolase 8
VDTIKQQIVENNLMSNVQSTGQFSPGARRAASQIPPAGTYLPTSQRGRQSESGDSSTRMPSPSQFQAFNPQEQPNRYSAPPDALAQRLARLKTTSPTANGVNSIFPSQGDNDYTYTENKTPRPSSYLSHGPTHGATLSTPQRRPLGPRNMGTAQGGPSLPPKIPINTSLPRAPDPAYSPIFTVPSQPPSNPPRTSTESFRPMHPRYSQLANSPRGSQSANDFDDNPYRSRTPNGVHPVMAVGSTTSDLPHRSTVSAQELWEHLRRYNVLLIDVRPREEFDGGHVYAKSIICIEP